MLLRALNPYLALWSLCFPLHESRPSGLDVRVPRPHQYEIGQEIIIKVQKTQIIGGPKTKEYKCTVIGEGADGVVGLYIKTIRDVEMGDDRIIIMKNVALGPPPMSTLKSLIAKTRTLEACRDLVMAAIQRSEKIITFWVEKKRHEDPKAGNAFVAEDMSQIVLIDCGRSERVVELTFVGVLSASKGFQSLLESKCSKKPSAGANDPPVTFQP
ncbi:hypothetical protein ARMSODRAFT_977042 [Armillaria solidipes]|uniref:Uncharacterized protein n=1 Tax=Armillaria solidipes TaxID=1076256 RepID=A0A2H3BLG3_9AGAR|nr:hypothetical protein ARMSODRAFT_977042 [Armillaria solidipes]